jgi:hypothetical protein
VTSIIISIRNRHAAGNNAAAFPKPYVTAPLVRKHHSVTGICIHVKEAIEGDQHEPGSSVDGGATRALLITLYRPARNSCEHAGPTRLRIGSHIHRFRADKHRDDFPHRSIGNILAPPRHDSW